MGKNTVNSQKAEEFESILTRMNYQYTIFAPLQFLYR